MLLSFQKRKCQSDPTAKHVIITFTVNINRKTSGKVSSGLRLNPKIWDAKNKCAKGTSLEAQIFNNEISSLKQKIANIKLVFEQVTKKLDYTALDIVEEFKKDTSPDAPTGILSKTFLQVYEEWLVKENIRMEWHKNTLAKHNSQKKNVVSFLTRKNIANILPDQIKVKHLDLLVEAQTSQKLSKNYIAVHIDEIKNVVQHAITQEYITSSSILMYEPARESVNNKIHLTPKELEMFEAFKTEEPKLQQAKDIFVFMCYTGQNYADYLVFAKNPTDYLFEEKQTAFIRQNRQKIQKRHQNKVEAVLPFLPTAKAIFERYDEVLPFFKTTKVLGGHLKVIGAILGIDEKKMSSKVARKTFANMFWNSGVKPLVIMKMMGHTSLTTTQKSYTDTSAEFIEEEMKRFF